MSCENFCYIAENLHKYPGKQKEKKKLQIIYMFAFLIKYGREIF